MDLKINFQETINVGKNVQAKGQEFSELLLKIKKANESLKAGWQGGDASKYTGAVEEQAMYMEKLATAIEDVGEFLIRVGKTYQEAMETNSSAIK